MSAKLTAEDKAKRAAEEAVAAEARQKEEEEWRRIAAENASRATAEARAAAAEVEKKIRKDIYENMLIVPRPKLVPLQKRGVDATVCERGRV